MTVHDKDFAIVENISGRINIADAKKDSNTYRIGRCSVACNENYNYRKKIQLECGPMPNVMADLPNIGGALCSTPQSLADAHY